MTSHRQVPGTAAGFVYQIERALHWLAVCTDPDAMVGVETDDDVSVREENGKNVDEQDKLSYKETGQPFQDRGIALWKTLAGWLETAKNGLQSQQEAELHLVTNCNVPSTALVRQIAKPDQSSEEISACIRELRSIAAEPSDTIQKYAAKIAAAEDDELDQLIRRIYLFDASAGTGSVEMRKRIEAELHLHPDDDGPRVVQGLLGWLVSTLQDRWRTRQPGWVQRKAFDAQYHAELDNLKRRRKRERAERMVPISRDKKEAARGRGFVERLTEIDLPDDEIDLAIDNYVRHSSENYRLALLGEYTTDDWDDFYDELQSRWKRINLRLKRTAKPESCSPEQHGRRVLDNTTDEDFRGSLGGESTTYPYFTQGGYQRLADEDQVWWHPLYVPDGDREEK